MVNIVAEQIDPNSSIMISHAMCLEDAQEFAQNLKSKLDIEPIITDLTQVIGCHTGPGLVAVFFFKK